MKNKIPVFLFLLLVCIAYSAHAAYRVKHTYKTADKLLAASWASHPLREIFTERTTFFQQPVAHADKDKAPLTKPDNGRTGVKALIWSLLGMLFLPLGVMAIYYGIKGLQKGRRKKGLAITGLILGIIEVFITLVIITVILS